MSRAVRRRGAALVALTASMGLVAGVPAISGGAAQSAEPTPDCAEAFPVSELVEGQPVDGLTVSKGTTPEAFTGEVIGVLEGGIAPGLDMVMVELTSSEIDRVGIWQGMSGSPVYADDGRLIGAVAYGLAWGPNPVAGVTPFEDMDEYLDADVAAPRQIKVGKAVAAKIAREAGVTQRQASRFDQLPMPLGISGISARRFQQAQDADRKYLGRRDAVWAGSAPSGADPDPSTVVAGGNIAAAVSYGDVTASGVGTATSVCDGRVVGFGHPMTFSGSTTLSLHPADALYIQADPTGPGFKVANLGAPAGTITDDRLTGITGGFGAIPETTSITSTVSMADRTRQGSTFVNLPAAGAEMTFNQHLANHDRVVDGIMAGSSHLDYTVSGTDESGNPFEIDFSDHFTSPYDITFDSAFDVADLVWGLTSIEGVSVDDVTMSSEVMTDKTTYTIDELQQRRKGKWVTLGKGKPAVVKAGKTLHLRAVLDSPSGSATTTYNFAVPKRFHDQRGFLSVTGGNWLYSDAPYKPSVKKIAKAVKAQVRNDATRAEFSISGRRDQHVERLVGPAVDKVVNGEKRIRVVVR